MYGPCRGKGQVPEWDYLGNDFSNDRVELGVQFRMQVVDIAGDFDIISGKYHVTGKPLESFGPETRVGVTQVLSNS